MIAGSFGVENLTASVERFDRVTRTFTEVGAFGAPRLGHAATKLRDGRVLITGGDTGEPSHWDGTMIAELYDPLTHEIRTVADMPGGVREAHGGHRPP